MLMHRRILLVGITIWVAGTLAIRLQGHRLLRPDAPAQSIILYVVSFFFMAWLARAILRWLRVDKGSWVEAATLLALPTLILDPFSCLFFETLFPNMDSAAAGIFGGWMLICCGGAVAGAWMGRA
jgi:hypothetical protein